MPMLRILADNPLLDRYISSDIKGYGIKHGAKYGEKWAISTYYGIVYLDPEFVKVTSTTDFPCDLFDDPKEVQWQINELRKNKTFSLSFDSGEFKMKMTLDPITLEGKDLGQLSLSLGQWWEPAINRLYISGNIDLLPSAISCHPHVNASGRLCYGDSSVGALTALKDGRFYDYFMLIESVLKAYDPSSAYWFLNDKDANVEDEYDDEGEAPSDDNDD